MRWLVAHPAVMHPSRFKRLRRHAKKGTALVGRCKKLDPGLKAPPDCNIFIVKRNDGGFQLAPGF